MGEGFLQDLKNQGAAQEAVKQLNMPRSQGGGYTTTQGANFNYTTPNAPYWGTYVDPVNVSPTTQVETTTPAPKYRGSGGQVYYDPQRGQYYTQDTGIMNVFLGGNGRNYIGSSPKGSKSSEDSFDNQTKLPSYSSYIPPEQMPNINAYLADPNSLLGAMQDAEIPMAGAGRYSSLLSTNSSKGK